jgi:hypothetical protein
MSLWAMPGNWRGAPGMRKVEKSSYANLRISLALAEGKESVIR